ncbi:MAG: hypothetical protein JOZ97_09370 [Candidatus Eremiobacteraeota bacterium]|nr:hypothetical protein [Candidatus Eremiobacteraeota bacterium]
MPEFRSLAMIFAAAEAPSEPAQTQAASAEPVIEPEADDLALSDARLMRAHLRETLDVALQQPLHDIVCEVVGRELELKPPAIENIVDRALERYESDVPLCLRVHPDDISCLSDIAVGVEGDETLMRGDVFLELRGGAVDLALGVRLENLLAS